MKFIWYPLILIMGLSSQLVAVELDLSSSRLTFSGGVGQLTLSVSAPTALTAFGDDDQLVVQIFDEKFSLVGSFEDVPFELTHDKNGRVNFVLSGLTVFSIDQIGFNATRRGGQYVVRFSSNSILSDLSTPKGPSLPERILVAVDAGHGGRDPGAVRGEAKEKDLMRIVAEELEVALLSTGRYDVFLTRPGDDYVSLFERRTRALKQGADIFVSLHADAILEGQAQGLTVYTLRRLPRLTLTDRILSQSEIAEIFPAATELVQFHQAQLSLIEHGFVYTKPRSQALAEVMVRSFSTAMGETRDRPLLEADLAVLKNPVIPSILVELGFLSNTRDLANLQRADWRARAISGIILALDEWAENDPFLRTKSDTPQ
ncbi:MAG: N-acetylmuramoyl-L-alanine amidase [Pseudomonadota bacterium]